RCFCAAICKGSIPKARHWSQSGTSAFPDDRDMGAGKSTPVSGTPLHGGGLPLPGPGSPRCNLRHGSCRIHAGAATGAEGELNVKTSVRAQLSQSVNLTPQLLQSIRLLQLTAPQLELELRQALDRNPMLETDEDNEVGETDVDDGATEVELE